MHHETITQEITRENRQDNPVVHALQRTLANSFVLYTNYKHYHWQTYGPLFRDLHKLFDELAKETLESVDEIAERLRMIGQDPEHDLRRMVEMASVHAAAPGRTMRERLEEADANLIVIIKEMRDAVEMADENHDPGTADLFSDFVRVHEKHEWFVRETLKRGDGLIS